MGRSAEKSDDELPTVGIYGIGMKRAIFKIGRSAVVTTRNDGCLYTVTIPEDWSSSEDDWNFPIEELHDDNVLPTGGTSIEIKISTMESLSFGTTLISLVCTLTSL